MITVVMIVEINHSAVRPFLNLMRHFSNQICDIKVLSYLFLFSQCRYIARKEIMPPSNILYPVAVCLLTNCQATMFPLDATLYVDRHIVLF